MEYLIEDYYGKSIIVNAKKEYIERGDYYLAFHKGGGMSIELCDSTYTSDHVSSHSKYYHKITKANREIHKGHALYNQNVKIDPTIGKTLIRNSKLESLLA
jgi:hypothetical protein